MKMDIHVSYWTRAAGCGNGWVTSAICAWKEKAKIHLKMRRSPYFHFTEKSLCRKGTVNVANFKKNWPKQKKRTYKQKVRQEWNNLWLRSFLSGDPERVGASTILMPTALTYDASDAHLSRWQQTIEKSLKECEICSMLTEKKNKKNSLIRTHLHNSPSFALTDKTSPLASKSKLPLSLICGLKPR